jgi:GDPmannose 4,6-dehydratase
MTTALITGITGQDGSYLAEYLLKRGYEVYGLVRGQANPREAAARALLGDKYVIHGDLLDQSSLLAALIKAQPDEVYNLGAVTYVPISWEQSELTGEVTGLGVLRLLEAIRVFSGLTASRTAGRGQVKLYQASSSEMFGKVRESPQTELTPFHPRSPYGAAKSYGHYLVQNYRESYGMFAVSGILFNHESPRRPPEFVVRKVTKRVAEIRHGKANELHLGNLNAKRDWGYAVDYVKAMYLMMQNSEAVDYVVGTGITYSVEEMVDAAFRICGLEWRDYVVTDAAFIRPAEVDYLCADPAKISSDLNWKPETSFHDLLSLMLEADLEAVSD